MRDSASLGADADGNEVRLISPAYVKPCLRRQKNDAADAAAICDVVTHPSMRFVPAKSEDQHVGPRSMPCEGILPSLALSSRRMPAMSGNCSPRSMTIATSALPAPAPPCPEASGNNADHDRSRDSQARQGHCEHSSQGSGQYQACHYPWHRSNRGFLPLRQCSRRWCVSVRPRVRGMDKTCVQTAFHPNQDLITFRRWTIASYESCWSWELMLRSTDGERQNQNRTGRLGPFIIGQQAVQARCCCLRQQDC